MESLRTGQGGVALPSSLRALGLLFTADHNTDLKCVDAVGLTLTFDPEPCCRYCEAPLKEELSLSGGGQSVASFTLEGGSVRCLGGGQTQDTVCVSELASCFPRRAAPVSA